MSLTVTAEVSLDSLPPLSTQDEAASQTDQDPLQNVAASELSMARTAVVIATLTGTTVVSSFSNGLLTVGLPRMAEDINLPANLLLWPASVYPSVLLVPQWIWSYVWGASLLNLQTGLRQGVF